ncbi:MAG: hypothetical protein AAB316_16125, partial [Bacteroidota bacterium]
MTFEATNTSYGRAVEITGGSHHIQFLNNLFDGVTTTSTSNNLAVVYSPNTFINHHNAFKNNHFRDGSYGIFFQGNYNGGNFPQGTVVEDNAFENQYFMGLQLNQQNSPVVRRNLVQSNTAYSNFFGISFYEGNEGGEITFNQVQSSGTGGYGIAVEYAVGTSSDPVLVANNFVEMGGVNNSYGIYSEYGEFNQYLFNTVHVSGENPSSWAFYNYYGTDKILKNNVLVSTAGGSAMWNYGGFAASDRNDFYAPGSQFAYFDGILQPDLAAWQAATMLDSNSVSVNPQFDTSFHVSAIELNAAAQPSLLVTLDLDGETRNATTPDIGADEFTPPANDANLVAFTSPVAPFPAGSQPVDVILKNNGTATLTSATIDWQVNAVAQTAVNWTGSL